MEIPYLASNFPASYSSTLFGRQILQCTWVDIVWAAITTGKPSHSSLLAHKWHSLADIIVRSHTIYANLRQESKYLKRSSLYDALDPTEKGAVSYFLGMAMAKLFATKQFDVAWLFHVSQATRHGTTITFSKGTKSQPDLIGQTTNGEWVIIEAKGRTNGLDLSAVAKAKAQTGMISTINGSIPSLRIALQVYFDEMLNVFIEDPIDTHEDAIAIDINYDDALYNYYAPAELLITKGPVSVEEIAGINYATRTDENSGITIGLDESLINNIEKRDFTKIRSEANQLRRNFNYLNDGTVIYPDGLLVKLDARWSSKEMELDPVRRRE